MSWPLARDQIISIVEQTPLTAKKRGASTLAFKYFPESNDDKPAPMRGFNIEVIKFAMIGALTIALPRRIRAEIELHFWYLVDVGDPSALHEIILTDHTALMGTLPDQSRWGRPASTIETLFLGSPLIGETELERVSGRVRAKTKLMVEFTNPAAASL